MELCYAMHLVSNSPDEGWEFYCELPKGHTGPHRETMEWERDDKYV